jgi:hypothetical protein
MALIVLPTELLERVVEESIPESFEALALTCRRLYEASKRYRASYHARKKHFRKLSFNHLLGRFRGQTYKESALACLMDFAKDPCAARFVRELDCLGMGEHNDRHARVDGEFYDTGLADREGPLRRLLWHAVSADVFSPREPDLCRDPEALERLVAGYCDSAQMPDHLARRNLDRISACEDYATTCMISLLPNVKTLTLWWGREWANGQPSTYDAEGSRMWVFLSTLASRANNPRRPLAGLSNLAELRLISGCGFGNGRSRIPIEQYLPLLTIDSLRTVFCGKALLSPDRAWPNRPPISQFSKNLQVLHLSSASFARSGDWKASLTALLARTPNLKVFSLSLAPRPDGVLWVPAQGIVDEVARRVGHSLGVLSLAVDGDEFAFIFRAPEPMTGQSRTARLNIHPSLRRMKQFKQLSAVTLDLRLFVGASGTRRGEAPERLVDILPPTVTGVTIRLPAQDRQWDFGPTSKETMGSLGRDFGSEWQTKLPKLSGIAFRGQVRESDRKELVEMFNPVAVEFSSEE